MDRRELLKMSLALVGSGAATSALAASDDMAMVEPREVDDALPGVFEQEDATLGASTFKITPPTTVSGWSQEKLLTQSIATALWTGRIYALTPEEKASPMYRAIIGARTEAMAETVYATAAHLEAMDEAALALFTQQLRDEPDLIQDVHDRLIAEGQAQGVPEETLDRFRRVHKHTAWRLQNQDVGSLRDELIGKLDRSAQRHGVDWRADARNGADLPFVRGLATDDSTGKAGGRERAAKSAEEYAKTSRKHTTAGAVMLGIGLPFAIGFGIAGFALPGFFALATAGLVLLIIGAIYLASGARNRKRAREAEAIAAEPAPQ